MTEIEVRPSNEIVLPHTGEVIDLSDEVACANAIDELRRLEALIADARRALGGAVVERARVLGTKSFALPGGRRAVITGGPSREYDAQTIERELREAGMPEERIREIVKEEVSYTVRAVEAKRAAGANEEYAAIIERNTLEVERPFGVSIKRA